MSENPSPRAPVILVLDDQAPILRAARRILEHAGYTVLTAASAHEALTEMKMRDGAIDLLLCDLVLPGLSGREAANLLLASNPEIKVVFMSGYSSHGSGRKSILEAGHTFLGKPFEMDDLLNTVRGALED